MKHLGTNIDLCQCDCKMWTLSVAFTGKKKPSSSPVFHVGVENDPGSFEQNMLLHLHIHLSLYLYDFILKILSSSLTSFGQHTNGLQILKAVDPCFQKP